MVRVNDKPGTAKQPTAYNVADLARWVPLRLSVDERSLLTVLEQTLHVSEYTDHVDITGRRGVSNKTRRILDGILEGCHIATGLAAGSGKERRLAEICKEEVLFSLNNKKKKKKKGLKGRLGGKKKKKSAELQEANPNGSWASRDPEDNAALFQTMFEIGRRNKVLNPAAMRTTYGKLMYLLQDAQNPTVAKSLGFSLHKDLVLVGPYLTDNGCGELLQDARLECAVQFINDRDPDTNDKLPRDHVQAMVQGKRRVMEELVEAYSKGTPLTEDDIRRAIESLADAIAYIESNVRPVQRMLQYLEDNFDPESSEKNYSLALRGGSRASSLSSYSNKYGFSAYSSGSEGPTLSHSHGTQYTFVWQSLRLWCKVVRNMHRLWVAADDDLLSTTSTYHLYNTGQGLNRVQSCPRVRKVMSTLLHQTQQEAGGVWVGLSVIHLGDRDVPNALIFIDKYTQIPRFLNPIVAFLQSLPELCQDQRVDAYVKEQFGSLHDLKMTVLADYFKHGFDGSGDDGGSCIDGRLTSSWNWTSRVAKKSYYHTFMLSGFQGFDGDFR
jgi:hypothetical protein